MTSTNRKVKDSASSNSVTSKPTSVASDDLKNNADKGTGEQKVQRSQATDAPAEANTAKVDKLADNRGQPVHDSLTELNLFNRDVEDYSDYTNQMMAKSSAGGRRDGIGNGTNLPAHRPRGSDSPKQDQNNPKGSNPSSSASKSKSRFKKPTTTSDEYLDVATTLPTVKQKPITPQYIRNRQQKNQINSEQINVSDQFLIEKQRIQHNLDKVTAKLTPPSDDSKNSPLTGIKKLLASGSGKKRGSRPGSDSSMADQSASVQLLPLANHSPPVAGFPRRTLTVCLIMALCAFMSLLVQKNFNAATK